MIQPLKVPHRIAGILALTLGALQLSAYEQGSYFIYDAIPAESTSETDEEVTATGRLPAPASLREATTDTADRAPAQTTAPTHSAFTLEQGSFGSSVFDTFESTPSAPAPTGFEDPRGL